MFAAFSNGKTEKAILFSISPTLNELYKAIESGSSLLPNAALDLSGDRRMAAMGVDGHSVGGSAVDGFAPVILMAMWQIILDVLYLLLFAFVCLVPWRLAKLLVTLFHSDDIRLLDIAKHVMVLKSEADRNLNEYRRGIVSLLNEMAKKNLNQYDSWKELHSPFLGRLEKFTLLRYYELYGQIFKILRKYEGKSGGFGIDAMAVTIPKLTTLHHSRLMSWGLKTALHNHFTIGNISDVIHGAAVELVGLRDKGYRKEQKEIQGCLDAQFLAMKDRVKEANERASIKHLFSRPTDETRKIIKDAFVDSVKDICVLFLLLFLFVSVTEVPAFIGDLLRHRNSDAHTLREMIICHIQQSAEKKKRLFAFIVYSLGVFVLVVGIPAYVEKIFRCENLDDATSLARRILRYFNVIYIFLKCLIYICHLLGNRFGTCVRF